MYVCLRESKEFGWSLFLVPWYLSLWNFSSDGIVCSSWTYRPQLGFGQRGLRMGPVVLKNGKCVRRDLGLRAVWYEPDLRPLTRATSLKSESHHVAKESISYVYLAKPQ